jgi:hypothetical protein
MRADDEHPREIDWEDVARLEMHPRRFGILKMLALDGGRTLSPSECAFELQTNISDANYHIKTLKEFRLVRLAHTIPVRGVAEHFYCLVDHDAADLFKRLGLPRDTR